MNDAVESWGNVEVYRGYSMGRSLLARLTARFDVVDWKGQPYSNIFNHEFRVFKFEHGTDWIFESLPGKGVRFTPLWKLDHSKKVAYYYLYKESVSQEDAKTMFTSCYELDGQSYNHWALVWLYIHLGLRRNRRPLIELKEYSRRYICSALVEKLNHVMGVVRGNVQTMTPSKSILLDKGYPASVLFGVNRSLLERKRHLTDEDILVDITGGA